MAACKRCGNELPPGALVCPSCPPRQQAGRGPALPAPSGSAPGYPAAAYPGPFPQPQSVQPVEYASSASWISNDPYHRSAPLADVPKGGFLVCTIAYLIDSTLISVSFGVLTSLVKALQLDPDTAGPVTFFIAILTVLYFPALWSDLGGGQTVGMRLFHLRIIRTNGRHISLARAFGRWIVWCFMGCCHGCSWRSTPTNRASTTRWPTPT